MRFAINAAGPAGAFSFPPSSAKDVLERIAKLEQQGFRHFVIKDEKGRIVTREELATYVE